MVLLAVFRYIPILSKTFKFSVTNCASQSLRLPIDCSDLKVIAAWRNLISHRPALDVLNLKFPDQPHPIFLMAKTLYREGDHVWFQPRPVGKTPWG